MPSEAPSKTELKFECELCLENYNSYDKKPHSLVPCGHAICLSCCNNLTKPVCPFCRVKYENKIPNWEIIKRLPKPTIPIIYYQIEIKMNSYKSVINDLSLIISKLNTQVKESIQLMITENDGNDVLNEKFKLILKKIDENHQENLEIESSLIKVMEALKNKIELDENKYNNDNLKNFKSDIEKLTIKTMDKICTLQKELNDFNQLFTTYNSKPNEEFMKKLEKMFLEISKPDPINLNLHAIFSANIIRPVATQTSNDPNNQSDQEQEILHFSTKQKRKFNLFPIIKQQLNLFEF